MVLKELRLPALGVYFALLVSAYASESEIYPLALSAQSLSGVAENTVITDIANGSQPGNFGWLTWAGSPSVPTLVTSLTPSGDSHTYSNPDNPDDSYYAPDKTWLSPKVAETFDGIPTYRPINQILYRAEDGVNSPTYGRWYGLAKPDSAATAEQMYNVFDYGNNITELSTYETLPNAMGWVGKVKGGIGYQVYFDNPRVNVTLRTTTPLPQNGF